MEFHKDFPRHQCSMLWFWLLQTKLIFEFHRQSQTGHKAAGKCPQEPLKNYKDSLKTRTLGLKKEIEECGYGFGLLKTYCALSKYTVSDDSSTGFLTLNPSIKDFRKMIQWCKRWDWRIQKSNEKICVLKKIPSLLLRCCQNAFISIKKSS